MAFDTKKALESWKKAKPLLLTDTGVSDFLRKMPTDAKAKTYLDELEKASKKLDTFMADKKIKAEKKAMTCLKQIQDDIESHLKGVKENRKLVLADMGDVVTAGKKYLAEAIKSPTADVLRAQWVGIAQLERTSRLGADPRAHAFDPPLYDLAIDWMHAGRSLYDAHDSTLKLIAFHEQKPLPDFKARMVQKIKGFGDELTSLDKIKQSVKNIQL